MAVTSTKRLRRTNQRLVTKHHLAILRPVRQQLIQLLQVTNLWHECSAALFSRFNSMSLKAVPANAVGIGKIRLHRTNSTRASG